MCTNVVDGFLYCRAKRLYGLAFVSGLGWMTIHLNNTCGFIRQRIRVILYARCEKVLPGMIVLEATITYDRSISTREAFVQEAASFVSFSDPQVRLAGRRHGKGRLEGSCNFEKGESAGQIRGFDTRVSKK